MTLTPKPCVVRKQIIVSLAELEILVESRIVALQELLETLYRRFVVRWSPYFDNIICE